jgi:hypothetical protein
MNAFSLTGTGRPRFFKNAPMKRLALVSCLALACGVSSGRAGTIVPGLDDSTALRTFTASQTVTNTAGVLTRGVTLAVRLTPNTTDLYNSFSGPVNLLEIGGTQNGSALVLLDGQYWFVTKTNNAGAAAPTGIADTQGIDNAVGVAIGNATANQQADLYASFDGNASRLIVGLDGGAVRHNLLNVPNWNWEGNGTLTFAGLDPVLNGTIYGSRGGLSEFELSRFFTNLASPFSGSVSLGQYFNDVARPDPFNIIPEPAAAVLLAVLGMTTRRRPRRPVR